MQLVLTGGLDFAYSQNSILNGSQSQPRPHFQHGSQQPPVPLFDVTPKQHSHPHTNIQSLLNSEDTSPTLVMDHQTVEQLHHQLTQRTSGCSVEQLEQINTHLMDCLWNMRGEWDRNKVIFKIKDTFNEVLDDMQSTQEFESISQKTKEQLGASSFRV
jgi:ATPase family AAA domain-containing protein 2